MVQNREYFVEPLRKREAARIADAADAVVGQDDFHAVVVLEPRRNLLEALVAEPIGTVGPRALAFVGIELREFVAAVLRIVAALFVGMEAERAEQTPLVVEQVEPHRAAQQRHGVDLLVGVGLHVEGRAEYADRLMARMDDEGVFGVVFDIEVGLAVEPHLAQLRIERGGIAQARRGLHRHARTVGEHQLRLASGVDTDCVVAVGGGITVESAPDEESHGEHGCCRHGDSDATHHLIPQKFTS